MNFEDLRQQYRPTTIRVLFVGESPPAGGTFFYKRDSRLYFATRTAFLKYVPELCEGDFLQDFMDLGCYLQDLSAEPLNRLRGPNREEKRILGIGKLSAWIRTLPEDEPMAVIAVLKGIEMHVRTAMGSAKREGRDVYSVPFPFDDDALGEYVDLLGPILRRLEGSILRRSG